MLTNWLMFSACLRRYVHLDMDLTLVLALFRKELAGSAFAQSETFLLAWRVNIFPFLWLKYK